jgi:hypothetical protein
MKTYPLAEMLKQINLSQISESLDNIFDGYVRHCNDQGDSVYPPDFTAYQQLKKLISHVQAIKGLDRADTDPVLKTPD